MPGSSGVSITEHSVESGMSPDPMVESEESPREMIGVPTDVHIGDSPLLMEDHPEGLPMLVDPADSPIGGDRASGRRPHCVSRAG